MYFLPVELEMIYNLGFKKSYKFIVTLKYQQIHTIWVENVFVVKYSAIYAVTFYS